MAKTVLIYGLFLAVMVGLLKFLEHRFFFGTISMELYVGLVAATFTAFGIWLGLKIINLRKQPSGQTDSLPSDIDLKTLESLKISKREQEVLELMAQGLSNQEIADRLFVSLPTVKSHVSNLFSKLEVKRRTQAVQRAKSMNIIA